MNILKNELNAEQLEIAKELQGNVLVIAGPGSGKTRLLVHRIGYQFRCDSNKPYKALCLTFTTEAAKELNARLVPIVPSGARNRVWCGNFHQYGQFLLTHYGHLIGFPRDFEVVDDDDASDILKSVLETLRIGRVDASSLAKSISKFRGRVNRPTNEELAEASGRFDEILKSYAQVKEANKVADFDDLIELPIKLLRENQSLREMLQDVNRYIYVDELQDTSLLQLEMLKEIYKNDSSSVFGVADEDQILYEWRDARLSTISEFQEAFNATPKFLVLNHRSPEPIVAVANALIQHNQGRYDKELRSAVTDRDGAVYLHVASTPTEEASFIANRIVATVGPDVNQYREIVVLARNGFMLDSIKAELRARNLPYVHIGDPKIVSSPVTKLLKGCFALAGGYPNAINRIKKASKSINTVFDQEVIRVDKVVEIVTVMKQRSPYLLMDSVKSGIDLESVCKGTDYADHLEIASKVIAEAFTH